MNSQQELLEAINTISQKKERSFDTPATVLRVEGDTVWVHIDGGADETPCLKTINCEEGETVQVRIANGSAFLVGNASAPPTDDKTANVAHFVAEQADEKATSAEEKAVEAIRSVEAISQTVEGKVDSGDSNITDISSTMYQDAYGVNIFNDTLAVGDSYAHIDGDSFDIKEATTAGVIDNTNDITLATFGASETIIGAVDDTGNRVKVTGDGIDIVYGDSSVERGWRLTTDYLSSYRTGSLQEDGAQLSRQSLDFSTPTGSSPDRAAHYGNDYLQISEINFNTPLTDYTTKVAPNQIKLQNNRTDVYVEITTRGLTAVNNGAVGSSKYTEVGGGYIRLTGRVVDTNDNYLTPVVLESTTISTLETSYTFSNSAIKADSVIDIYDTIFGFAPSNIQTSAGSCTITFPAQSSSHTIKLFVY